MRNHTNSPIIPWPSLTWQNLGAYEMKTMTKNLLIVTTLAVISANAFSQTRRSDDDRRRHYRGVHQELNICLDIKQALTMAENAYLNFEQKIIAADRKISDQRIILNNRRSTLESKKNAYEETKRQKAELEQLRADKPRLMIENQQRLNDANAQLPGLKTILDAANRTKDEKCKGLVRVGRRARECKEAKSAQETAERNYNRMNSQKMTAENTLARLANVDRDLKRINEILVQASETLTREQAITPTIAELSTALSLLVNQRNEMAAQFNALEDELGLLEVKHDKCVEMRYAANNGKAFKRALLVFAENNGEGCNKFTAMIRGAKGPAEKDGVDEAFKLYCESEALVRFVEVPATPVGQ